jgi:hypothetical protein
MKELIIILHILLTLTAASGEKVELLTIRGCSVNLILNQTKAEALGVDASSIARAFPGPSGHYHCSEIFKLEARSQSGETIKLERVLENIQIVFSESEKAKTLAVEKKQLRFNIHKESKIVDGDKGAFLEVFEKWIAVTKELTPESTIKFKSRLWKINENIELSAVARAESDKKSTKD